MTQAVDIINNALVDIGALAIGETADANTITFAFNKLNNLLDRWSNEKFLPVSVNEIVGNIAGATTWTIGPTGQIVSQRPLGINSAFVRVSSSNGPIDFPVAVINVEQYELIGLKQLPGPWPRALWYNSGTPNGTIYLWPLPAAGELHVFAELLFTAFATINDTVNFPQGYVLALEWALAEQMLPAFGRTDPALAQMVAMNTARAMAAIKTTNMNPPQTVQFDRVLTGTGRIRDAGFIMNGGFY
jgi:hypothetical protein